MRAAKSKNDSIIREFNGFDRQEKKDLTRPRLLNGPGLEQFFIF